MTTEQGLFGEPKRSGGSAAGSSGDWITAYCDGGSRGNPGPAGYGAHIVSADGQTLAELSEYLGRTTNNVAEYSGLLGALEFALREGHKRMRVIADSELMVKQMQGRYKVNSPDLRPLYEEAKRRVAQLEGFRIEHVLRGRNQKADRLANLAMDKGMGMVPGQRLTGVAPAPTRVEPPPRPLKGFVKGGVVHLLEGELPDGTFVTVVRDRQ